jgi:hypothetical protein
VSSSFTCPIFFPRFSLDPFLRPVPLSVSGPWPQAPSALIPLKQLTASSWDAGVNPGSHQGNSTRFSFPGFTLTVLFTFFHSLMLIQWTFNVLSLFVFSYTYFTVLYVPLTESASPAAPSCSK